MGSVQRHLSHPLAILARCVAPALQRSLDLQELPTHASVPLESPGERPLGFVPGSITDSFFEPLSEAELAAWE